MSEHIFQEGDRIRMKRSCSGAVVGKVYVLRRVRPNKTSSDLYAQIRPPSSEYDNPGCSCYCYWEYAGVEDPNMDLFNTLQ